MFRPSAFQFQSFQTRFFQVRCKVESAELLNGPFFYGVGLIKSTHTSALCFTFDGLAHRTWGYFTGLAHFEHWDRISRLMAMVTGKVFRYLGISKALVVGWYILHA